MKHVSSKIQVRYRKNRQTFFILIKINIDNNYLLQQPAVGCFTQRYACTIFSLFQLARIQSENISINFRTSQQRTIFGNLYLYIYLYIYIFVYTYIYLIPYHIYMYVIICARLFTVTFAVAAFSIAHWKTARQTSLLKSSGLVMKAYYELHTNRAGDYQKTYVRGMCKSFLQIQLALVRITLNKIKSKSQTGWLV